MKSRHPRTTELKRRKAPTAMRSRGSSAADLQKQLDERTRELGEAQHQLAEALEQRTATSAVLQVISSSPADLTTVFNAVLANAIRLCEAKFGVLHRYDGHLFWPEALVGVPQPLVEFHRRRGAFEAVPGTHLHRLWQTREVVHTADDAAGNPPSASGRFGGARSHLAVPMLKGDALIGAIIIYRQEVRPFTDGQIGLVESFASQAVIAIENARLFEEVQARTHELRDALEFQTATSEVLSVISRSALDLQRVLDTLVESAARLCDAFDVAISQVHGSSLRLVAHHGHIPFPGPIGQYEFQLTRQRFMGRAFIDRRTTQVADMQAEAEEYPEGREIALRLGWRTGLAVPLLRAGEAIGVIMLRRREVRPFTHKQISLLNTFADQAVIAIGNARLFNEIAEKGRELEVASQHKSRFLAAASHDLRQPMHALGLFVAQLRSHITSAAGSRLVDCIDDAVAGMNELFNALLDITKLDAGALTPTIAEFPIAELLGRIGSTFAAVAQEKGLSFRLAPSSAWVRSDPVLLERIVLNLVSNAVRYTTCGGIVVGCRRRGTMLRIEVADSGPGIAEDQRRKIFTEFYRLADDAKTNQAGLGLGLAIVERLCALLDHPIGLASRPGKGSRFSVTVPTAPAAALPKSEPSQPAAIDVTRGKLVVVIDNDTRILEGMGGLLRNWGCRVVTAATPEAALTDVSRIGREARPDLIISDYHLAEGQSGITAIAKLREVYGAIPAFVMSGDTAPERLREAQESGHHLLHKPVQPMTLRAMMSRFLKSVHA
jgi:signal transduction histidine kinase/CheY-like chemotaxis protein